MENPPLDRRDAGICAALVAAIFACYWPFQSAEYGGDPLISACILQLEQIPASYVWHFAHFAVMPIYLLVAAIMPGASALNVVVGTQILCGALGVAILYLVLRLLIGDRWLALLGALLVPATHGFWLCSTTGEEKGLMFLGMALFVAVLFRQVGLLGAAPLPDRPWVLGALLVLAVLLHLGNAVLAAYAFLLYATHVLLVVKEPRRLIGLTAWMAAAGAVLAGIYVLVGVYVQQVRSVAEFREWMLQYHTGSVLKCFYIDENWLRNLRWAFLGIKKSLMFPLTSDDQSGAYWLFVLVFIAAGLACVVLARRRNPMTTWACLLFFALHGMHYLFYEPHHWESWVNPLFFAAILLTTALSALPAKIARAAAGLLLATLLAWNSQGFFAPHYNFDLEVARRAAREAPPKSLVLHDFIFLHMFMPLFSSNQSVMARSLYPETRQQLANFRATRGNTGPYYLWTEGVDGLNRRISGGQKAFLLCINHPAVLAYYGQFLNLGTPLPFTVSRQPNGREPIPLALVPVEHAKPNPKFTMENPQR